MKKILLIAAALFVGAVSFAQETNLDAEGNKVFGPYETNAFKDNWFVDFGAGIQWTTTNLGFNDPIGWAGNVNVGKWFTPEWGARAGVRFGTSPWDVDAAGREINGFQFWKADFLVNLSNLFGGYSSSRKWNFTVPVGFGMVMAYDSQTTAFLRGNKEFGAEAGIIANYAFSPKFGLNCEFSGILDKEAAFAGAGHNTGRIPFILFPTLTIGGIYNFDRADWTRKSSTVAAYAAAVAAAEAAAAQAKAAADAAKAAANAQQEKAAQEVEQVKEELAVAQNQSNYDGLFDEPIIAYFQIGKSTLSSLEKEHVKYVAKNLIARGENVRFTLSGNADSKTGTAKRNQQLSEERAAYVYKMMTEELGIDGSRFTVKANGGNDIFDSPELNRAVIIEKE